MVDKIEMYLDFLWYFLQQMSKTSHFVLCPEENVTF